MSTIIIALILILISGWILAIALGFSLPYNYSLASLLWLKENSWESSALAILLCVIGILVLIRPRPDNVSFATSSKMGEVRVSRQAIKDIIAQSAANLPQIRSIISMLRQRNEGLVIQIDCQMAPDSVVTELSAQLQEQVKQDVERYTGIKVAEVKVLVRSIDGAARKALVR